MKNKIALAMLFLLFLTSCDISPRQNVLRIGYMDYSFDRSVVHVLKGILDQQPSLDVQLLMVPDSTMFRQLSTGELDIGISAWMPVTHKHYFDLYPYEISNYSMIVDSLGVYLAVPEYLEIDRISELRNYASSLNNTIFVPDGNNAVYEFAKDLIEDYNLVDFRLHESTFDNIMYFVEESLRENIPFAIVTIRPHHSFKKYGLKILTDTRHSFGDFEQAYIVVNSNVPEKMPVIADFLAQIRFTLSDIEELMELNQVLGTELYENALRWISQNTRRINTWLLGN